MNLPPDNWVRVLLFDNITACEIQSKGGFELIDENSFRITPVENPGGEKPVRIVSGKMKIGKRLMTQRVELRTLTPHVVRLNERTYRGHLIFRVNEGGETFDVVNLVPMEAYLGGVVGAEMPASWNREALRAQAIAARTYAFFNKRRFGSRRDWDVKCTQASQVYKGIDAETTSVWNAVLSTSGQVLECRQDHGWDIFPTYYHSTSGGHTENSRNVFGDSYPSLRGVDSPYCKMTTKPSVFFWPAAEFNAKEVSDKLIKRYPSLANLEEIVKIEPHKESDYGNFSRTHSFRLTGKNGKVGFLRGEDLRLTIDPTGRKIKSVACEVIRVGDVYRFHSGRGYGHGVGMSQYGAQAMAKMGKTAEEILFHYYPESRIARKY